jgi:predicted small secreted protein
MRMRTVIRSLLLVVLTVGPALVLAGCNTIAGVGRDIGAAGRGIERGAERVRPY